ncbi:hypothetical protein ACEZDB_32295 [Streptacidiphilus sp. N1-3]|uniref:Uncharacterized protein n=1 Tax=Streptacidiphilus alkalitolerans TaxID=3342712 RepID=A0ABV6XAP0_9ACTN
MATDELAALRECVYDLERQLKAQGGLGLEFDVEKELAEFVLQRRLALGPKFDADFERWLIWCETGFHEDESTDAFAEFQYAVIRLREATENGHAGREIVGDFLRALAKLVGALMDLVRALLSLFLSRTSAKPRQDPDIPGTPALIDKTPQLRPRSCLSVALPVGAYRGGRRSSALGSAVLAA